MDLVVDFWDVGQGDCSVVSLPDGKILIIDTGPPDSPIVDWLLGRGEVIYGIVLTHNHEDHVGCLQDMLVKFADRIENVFLLIDRDTNAAATKAIYSSVIRWAKRPNRNVRDLTTGVDGVLPIYGWTNGSAKMAIYTVLPGYAAILGNIIKKKPDPNQVSAALCLDVNGRTEVIWGGDAHMNAIADKCCGKSPEVMVGPHHGAPKDRNQIKYEAQFDKIEPANVFVSVGTGNGHEHPVKSFIELHKSRQRRVVCSQLVHCDNKRRNSKKHVMRHHLLLGMVPPLNSSAVTCRGPMRLTWNAALQTFLQDDSHYEHLERAKSLHRPYCI